MRLQAIAIASIITVATAVVADEIYFNNGRIYACEVIGYSNAVFTLTVNGAAQLASIKNIDKIVFSIPHISESDFMASNATDSDPAQYSESSLLLAPEPPSETLTDHIKKNTYGEATISIDIKDIPMRMIELDGKPIKLTFSYRYDIKQVNTNEYQVSLYDKELNSVTMIFPATALSYVRQINDRFAYTGTANKKFALYGVLFGEKNIVTFNRLYWYSADCIFVPFGRKMNKTVGGAVTYTW